MDLKTLQEYKKEVTAIGILLLVVAGLLIFFALGNLTSQGVNQAQPLSNLTFKDNKIDPNSQAAKNGQKAVNLLSSSLPHRQEITVSTGTKVIYTLSRLKTDPPYFVRAEIFPELFLYDTKSLAKNVLEFRETAKSIYAWAKTKGVAEGDLLIRWGSHSYDQDRAEAWIKESSKFPAVVKQGNTYVFK